MLCCCIDVEMISIGQPFAAGHVCFPEKWWFGSLGMPYDAQLKCNVGFSKPSFTDFRLNDHHMY